MTFPQGGAAQILALLEKWGSLSTGKTVFAMQVAAHNALNGGRALVFSLEMSRRELYRRLVGMIGCIPIGLADSDNLLVNRDRGNDVNEISIRERLWEWSRAYPERAGDSVSWPCMAAFGRGMLSGRRESPVPIDCERAALTDAAVLAYLNVIARRQDKEKVTLEWLVFWFRYYYRWEMQDVCRKADQSKSWVINMCKVIEGTMEALYLAENAA
ncbi:DnaB-like helicase C-terminal domain-containing protein [uncultured Microbulbifer sp.]|uniref:DnaB-like helicase C-terminal domain-containing protein n=1 Tax=uncultured Microbulbifer sp. TaxID=348147 RepID=UPI002620D437|nr:DnaB-like helicase C-terminal domain-containing protein [uncultured Microbulbifer sp.]